MKEIAYFNIWGTMSTSGLSKLHLMPEGQTVNTHSYKTEILEKELKQLFKITKSNKIYENLMVVNKNFTFQQDGTPAHTSHGVKRIFLISFKKRTGQEITLI